MVSGGESTVNVRPLPLFVANWKMNFTAAAVRVFERDFKPLVAVNPLFPDIVLAPPFTALWAAGEALRSSGIRLGAQNVHWLESGAHTGEVSAPMLSEFGVDIVIVGHSERRQHYGETNETVALRARAAIDAGLEAIVCVGESLDAREAGRAEEVTANDLTISLSRLTPPDATRLTVAYEPVWAIGSGWPATPEIAGSMHQLIRSILVERFGGAGEIVRILYGGSTTAHNVSDLLKTDNIDGALVGGAALKPESFAALINAGRAARGEG